MSQPLYPWGKELLLYPLDWVGPMASLDAVTKRKNPIIAPARNQTPVIQAIA